MRISSTLCRLFPAVALLVAACTPPVPETPSPWSSAGDREAAARPRLAGEVSTVLAVPAATVLSRASAALRAQGFTIQSPDEPGAPLRASNDAQTKDGWASCPWITTRDPMSEAFRFTRTEASSFRTVVTVSTMTTADGETQVGVSVLNVGTYLNAFTNAAQEAPCRSTGVLEKDIVDAIRGGA